MNQEEQTAESETGGQHTEWPQAPDCLKALLWVTGAASVVGIAGTVTLGYAGLGTAKWAFFIAVIPGLVGIVAALRVRKNNRCRSVRPNSFVAEVPLLMTWIPGTIAAIALIATLFLLLIVVSVGN